MQILDFASGILISTSILFFRHLFYNLALNTTYLLDIIFNETLKEERKFNLLISNFRKTIKSLLFFFFFVFFIVLSFFVRVLLYAPFFFYVY